MKQIFVLIICLMAASPILGDDQMELNENAKNVIILLGPPGSGKGTQAKKIAAKLNIPHISTGDLFRENMKKETELGKKAKSFMDAGKLVPDAVVLEMLFDRVANDDGKSGYLLDGFPRTIPQAEALDKHLSETADVKVINLHVSDEMVIKRISGRLSCPKDGTVYNIFFNPPKEEGICDIDGEKLIQRADDKPEVVKERLKVYKEQTEPLIEYYEKQGKLKTVDGEKEPDQVFQEIMTFIDAG